MDVGFNTSRIFKIFKISDTLIWSSSSAYHHITPISVLTILVTFLVLLIGILVRGEKVLKSAVAYEISFAKNTSKIPSVSLLQVLKWIYEFGPDFQKILDVSVEKYGEIFNFNLLGFINGVFISNPTMVQKLLMSTKPEHLEKTKHYELLCFGELKIGLLCSTVETWKPHRKIISEAFAYKGLLRQLSIFEEHAKTLVLTLQEALISNPCKTMLPVEEQVDKVTFQIISHVVAGKQVTDLSSQENQRFRCNIEKLKQLISYRFIHFINTVEFIWNLNPKKRELDRAQDGIVCYYNKIVNKIRKECEAGLKNDDDMAGKSLAELMIRAGFSNNETFIEISTFLFGGHETTSTTLKLLLFLLASHKEYQDKCRKEIDHMFDQMFKSNTNEISMEALHSLSFLDMCIKECLRMYPVFPIFGRKLESSIQLDETTSLPSGTTVFTSPWKIHRNPKIYPEPEKFDPERFSSDNVKKRGAGEFIPFSLGPRNCIGYKSAIIELKVLTAYILQHFEVHSEMSVAELNFLVSKVAFPFPEINIKVSPLQ